MMQVNKILFITLSNIGDVILTLPALDILREHFPQGKITVMVGPLPKELFLNNPYFDKVIVFDKHAKLRDKIILFNSLRRENFDIIVDLRNSLFGALLPAKYKTSPFLTIPKALAHMKERHLYKLKSLNLKAESFKIKQKSLYINPQDEEYIRKILKENGITEQDKIVIIASGARSHVKRWAKEKFVELISLLIKDFGMRVVLVGDRDDMAITEYITQRVEYPILNLSGKTSIMQLGFLLKKATLLVANDSAVLHLASYLNVPVVAVFGPTNELKYGPWSEKSFIITREVFCRPCERAQCGFGTIDCMRIIKVEDVIRQVSNMLNPKSLPVRQAGQIPNQYKRILIVRTDRIGDVLLSTPVIKALRDNYPNSYIAMMVSPYAKEIVEGNPYLDEVIIYDKNNQHKSGLSSLKFAIKLKKKRFDLAIILHPTNRVHLVAFFAGIPRRVGYEQKLGFLLTDKIKHTKQLGEKHELEYSLDLVRYLGIEPKQKDTFMPIRPEAEKWAEGLLEKEGLSQTHKLLAINPGASCPSKIWPNERFAEVADKLIEKYGFEVLLVAAAKDICLVDKVIKHMRHPAINLAGKTSISQLASLLKRCRLFISNDSGPVHIASSVGTPVISIFGRNQKGLSPKRWRPLGRQTQVLHQEVGCIECLAHSCVKDFACLKAITVEDVLRAADLVLH